MVAITLLGLPVSAQALGFGVPVLQSHLNEILDVRVPLLLMEDESLNNVFIAFAKPNEYRLVGLEPYTDLSGMRISVEHMKHGEVYVLLSSISAVQSPIVSLLLKARIGHNTYYKQVQVLLDSMELGESVHAVTHHQTNQLMGVNKASLLGGVKDLEQGWARTWRYGPVRSGDSLSTIAYRLRRDKQWSNHDVMLALYRLNPAAFIDHDINRLKSGVWLEVPHEKTLKSLLKQAPEAYENLKRKPRSVAKKKVATTVKPEEISLAGKKDNTASQLRYVGRIALGNAEHVLPPSEPAISKNSEQLQQQLNKMYKQAMDDHLQMASLDKNIMAIRDNLGQLSDDITALKEQQNAMQQQMANSPSRHYWMLGFLLLCLLNVIFLGVFLYRRYDIKKKEKYDIEEKYFNKKVKEPEPVEEFVSEPKPIKKEVRKEYLLANKIYDIENHLNLRNYKAAEDILKQLSQSERDHFGVCALNVRLYHEMGRLDERDSLIRNKQVSLNDRQWYLLCDRLPINVWHALHESGVIKDNGTLVDVEDDLAHGDEAEQASSNQLPSDSIEMDISPLTSVPDRLKDEGIVMTLTEDDDLSIAASKNVDKNDNFLELNDNEFKTMGEHPPIPSSEDEFISTVFVTTKDGKKKLL
ncbi:MAG: FimV/HubP family polar landmark protein [Mariprofundaceae bacterium]|nr:FimV/HubP family polar landmark protein [Mariprofundaceae bacterium]